MAFLLYFWIASPQPPVPLQACIQRMFVQLNIVASLVLLDGFEFLSQVSFKFYVSGKLCRIATILESIDFGCLYKYVKYAI